MKFSDFEYKRPDIKKFEKNFNDLICKFNDADSFEAQDTLFREINKLRNEFESMEQIAYIRYSINTQKPEFEEEQNFFDNNRPIFEGLISKYYKALISSKYRKEMETKYGKQLFSIAEKTIKTFSPEIMEELKIENKLMSEYTKLLSSAKILFDDEYRNLPQMRPFEMSIDRDVRKKAAEAKYIFFKENESKFDEIYDKLVKVRTKIANKLGYDNFVPVGYARMLRIDYTPQMIADLREMVKQEIVPLASKLREMQRQRLRVDKLKYYDEPLIFKDGNAKPEGNSETILNNGRKMYSELSNETREFINYMLDNELMDVLAKEGKSPGGYCTYIPKYSAPFIFSNFNGTADDIDVLTHEAGHAFQVSQSRDFNIPEYSFPTLDACEIHSMSMEFITWPWMKLFFGKNADRYKYGHLSESLLFIPYGVTVDEFQHLVYENPEWTPKQRKEAWRNLEKKYLPHRDYEDNEFLENGGFWYKQGHIFKNPFYYIDYVLAALCAFQFWKKSREDKEESWKDYLTLCRAGGSKSFLGLVELANLQSPFKKECIKSIVMEVEKWFSVNKGI